MASQKNFAITPSVSISRSKFKRPFNNKTSFQLGKIVPIYLDADILPGDTVSIDLASLIRMSTPIAPIMDNIYIDYYAFACPNRILWSHWKNFMGENSSSYGAVSEPSFPYLNVSSVPVHSLGDYLGLRNTSSAYKASALPGLAYLKIYNEWFRDQNLISPLALRDTDGYNSYLGTDPNNSNAGIDYSSDLLVAAKISDYFSRSLPYAQKGNPVTLPLGNTAPVTGGSSTLKFFTEDGSTTGYDLLTSTSVGLDGPRLNGTAAFPDGKKLTGITGLVADLSQATAATINDLRFAFQYQKMLEKDALYGTRYWEILKGHFGIEAPDASLQRPELLGHFRQHINIDQVLQTTGYNSTPSSNSLGTPGANSVSGKSGSLFTKSFVEHSILMIVAVARHDQTYGQGLERGWFRFHRTDYYMPVFANLGAQKVLNKEIYVVGTSSQDDGTFGFQEAWAEYRYKPNQVSGLMNPARTNSLSFWDLANNFGSLPTLSKSFVEQDRTNLARALVTGISGPDFIADFYFDATYVRPMPMYSIPGLIDHH